MQEHEFKALRKSLWFRLVECFGILKITLGYLWCSYKVSLKQDTEAFQGYDSTPGILDMDIITDSVSG